MQSGSGDKRLKLDAILREARAELDDGAKLSGDVVERVDDGIGQLIEQHEALRREVALLKARLADIGKPSLPAGPAVATRSPRGWTATILAAVTLAAGLLVARARRTAR